MSNTLKTLENLIAITTLRQKVIARNIANVNTENYKREKLVFNEVMSDTLGSEIKKTNSRHLGDSFSPGLNDLNVQVVDDPDATYNSGINNVNIDQEMAELAENSIMFKFAARKISGYFKTMQSIIKGGGGA